MRKIILFLLVFFSFIAACTNNDRKKKAEEKLQQLLKEGKEVVTVHRADGTVEYIDKNESFIAKFEEDQKLLSEDQKKLAYEMEIPTTFFINIKKIVDKDFEKMEIINKTGKKIPSKMMPRMIIINNILFEQKMKIENDFKNSPTFYKETIPDNWHCENYGINIYFTKNSDDSYNLIVSKL
jgi:preprotein translocase subunit YajC